jgi:hypothetical protein
MCALYVLKSTLLLCIQDCKYGYYIFNVLTAGWAEKTDVFILSFVYIYEFKEWGDFHQGHRLVQHAQQFGWLYKYILRCYVIFLCDVVISENCSLYVVMCPVFSSFSS